MNLTKHPNLHASCMLCKKQSKKVWTVNEVNVWLNENHYFSKWEGLILYQGSDEIYHHHIGQYRDEWICFNIKREEFKVEDEKPFLIQPEEIVGYYYVDPTENFKKTKDFHSLK